LRKQLLIIHHLARVVVSIFREHTVRRYLNPPSLPHCLTVNGGAVCFDAYHPLAVEGTPGTLALLASNGEITAAHNARRLESVASAFNLLGVEGVELKPAKAAISLAELHRNDGGTSALNEPLDEGSLVGSDEGAHGKKKKRGSRLVASTIVWIQPSSVACSHSVIMSWSRSASPSMPRAPSSMLICTASSAHLACSRSSSSISCPSWQTVIMMVL
jgi:hypothetical protein